MALIQWSGDWETGNSVIDYDHQMLVTITNQIFEIRRAPGITNAKIKQALIQLVRYVDQHFAREEALFSQTDYPHVAKHIAMHRELEKVVGEIVDLFEREPDLLNLDEVIEFLRRWLVDHILKHDMGYKKYLS